ncbi:cell wall-associated (serine) protease, partial [Listeria fleischmannii]|nr:cell wall-associated (serine) protease [Listeria fleischmannii]
MENYRLYDTAGNYTYNSMVPQNDQSLNITHKRIVDNGYIASIGQNVKVIPGHRYRLSAAYKYVSGSTLEYISFRTANKYTDVEISNSQWLLADNPTPKTYTTTVTAPSDMLKIDFKVVGLGDAIGTEGTINLSHVSLVDLDATDITIGAVNTKSTTVTGSATPNAKIDIFVGEAKIGTGTASATGEYNISIPRQAKDTVITAKDNATQLSKTTIVEQGIIDSTTIGNLYTTSTAVSGKAEPNADMVIKNSANTVIATGKSDNEGNYQLPIAPQKFDDTITATATFGGQTSAAHTKVQDTSTPNKPTVNPVTDQDTSISGKGTPGDKVQFTIGGQTYVGTINAAGDFSVVVPKISGGTVVNVVEVNPNNENRSTPTEVTIRDTTLGEPTIAPIKAGDTKVVITGEPGATVILTTPDGDRTSKTADATGKTTFTVDPARVGDTFTATQTGANGKASPAATANVTAVVTAGTITTKDFTLGKDKNIEGTYTGDVKSFRVTIDGTVYAGGSINTSSKTYTFYALDKITKTGSFKIEGLDASGRVLDTKTGNIVANQTPNTP